MFNIIVVGADASLTARRALETAAELAALSGGTLHIVSVYERANHADNDLPVEFRNMGNEGGIDALLQSLSFVAKNKGVDALLHSFTGDPADAIVATADKVGADLIVVGNRGMKGARRVLGSVPNSVAHGANCSVAIIDTTE